MAIILFNLTDYFFSFRDGRHPPKELIYLKGYIAAGVELAMITRLVDTRLRILSTLIGPFARIFISTPQSHFYRQITEIVTQNCYVLVWFGYVILSTERQERNLFVKYWEMKDQLTKFKQLITEHLSQSIVIFQKNIERRLFSNLAYSKLFNQQFESNFHHHTSLTIDNQNQPQPFAALSLENIKIETKTLREVGGKESLSVFPHNTESIYFKEFIKQVTKNELLNDKPVIVSASHTFKDKKKYFEVTICRLKWEQEDAIAVILNDVSSKEKILQLKLANEHKDKTIATVSHELRTPLGGIIGILEACENKVNPEVGEYLDLCQSNANLLMGLVNSLLDYQQLRHGRIQLNPTVIDVRQMLKSITGLFNFTAIQKEIFIKAEMGLNAPSFIYSDGNRIKQILINLVGNA
ncbi:MAG: hypothetical protein EOO43_20600, partial [Flavobacterium sp.]